MFQSLLFTLALFLLLTVPSGAHGSFVYVTNYGDGTVSQFRANPNGTLTALNPPTVKAWPRCHSLAADPTGRFLYVLSALDWSRRNCLISEYRINTGGRLTPLMPLHVSLPSSDTPYLLFIEPMGHFLYVLERGGMLFCFHIGATGTLKSVDLPPQDVGLRGSFGYSAVLDQTHSVFYASGETRMTNALFSWLTAFRVAKNGSLHSVRSLLFKGETQKAEGDDTANYLLQAVSAHRGRWVYLLYDWYSFSRVGPVLLQYKTHKGGGLVPLTPTIVPLNFDPKGAAADPLGKFLYILASPKHKGDAPETTNIVILAQYKLGSNGALGQLRQQIFDVPGGLSSPVFDPTGQFLYLLTGNGVRSFRVGANGSVSLVGSRSIRAGREPLGMVFVRR